MTAAEQLLGAGKVVIDLSKLLVGSTISQTNMRRLS